MKNTPETSPPDSLGLPASSAACPEWKTLKHIHDQQEQVKVRAMTVEEALPSSVHRLGWLQDRDAQLHRLLDYLQSIGIPMGSETWALRALLKIRRLEAESDAARRVLRALNDRQLPDLESMRLEFEHARAMHAKDLPPMDTTCNWCGWPGARLIGGGYAACEDCLPNVIALAPPPQRLASKKDVPGG
jgi:hypothetical protein